MLFESFLLVRQAFYVICELLDHTRVAGHGTTIPVLQKTRSLFLLHRRRWRLGRRMPSEQFLCRINDETGYGACSAIGERTRPSVRGNDFLADSGATCGRAPTNRANLEIQGEPYYDFSPYKCK